MKKLTRTIASLLCVLIVILTMTTAVFASGSIASPKGDSDIPLEYEPLSEQFEELLRNSSSEAEREIILKKAYSMGVTASDLSDIEMSSNELSILSGDVTFASSIVTNRRILTDNSGLSVISTEMPSYCLWPTIYMQERSDYCSAATIYTVAKYIGASPLTQEEIMDYWIDLGYTYPDLDMIKNYLNNKLSNKPSSYVKYVRDEYTSQDEFNENLANDVLNYQPMILNLCSVDGWPYTTSGHFCICNGLLTWEDNQYFIGDPYYFLQYVSSATNNNGELKVTWSVLDNAIKSKTWNHGYHLT